jgi:hypothetical protein
LRLSRIEETVLETNVYNGMYNFRREGRGGED